MKRVQRIPDKIKIRNHFIYACASSTVTILLYIDLYNIIRIVLVPSVYKITFNTYKIYKIGGSEEMIKKYPNTFLLSMKYFRIIN